MNAVPAKTSISTLMSFIGGNGTHECLKNADTPHDGTLRINSYAISKHFILAERSAGVNFVSSLAIEEFACNFVIGLTSDHGTDSSVPLPWAWNRPLCNLCFAIVINYSKIL